MNAFCTSTTLPIVGNTRCELSSWSRQSRRSRIRCASGAAVPLRQRTAAGLAAFQPRRDETPWQARELVNQIAECVAKRDVTALRDRIDELATMKEWLLLDKFDRREVNRRLRQYAAGDDEWRWQ